MITIYLEMLCVASVAVFLPLMWLVKHGVNRTILGCIFFPHFVALYWLLNAVFAR